MPAVDAGTVLAALSIPLSFAESWDRGLVAIGTLLVVAVVVFAVDRAFKRRGRSMARRVVGGDLDPVLETRLRFVRRFVEAAIVVIGIAVALSQFTALDRFAASILASGAIAAAVIGFAAQRVLGNVIAGVSLAITQPIRIGDLVSFEDHRGVVEDIRLTHTYLQTGVDTRIVVPNGRLADAVIRNDSIVTETVGAEAEVWLAHEADELRAVEVLEQALPGVSVTIKAVTHEGTTIALGGPHVTPAERVPKESELRRAALEVLRNAQLR
jgi:small-conductance mechanosensitive channel